MAMKMGFILNRLKERSTWRGVIFLATGLGLGIAPGLQEAIIASGVAVAGLFEALLPDPSGRMTAQWFDKKEPL